ncbi:unnamed protein product [Callosobruchus maculatus]|uniref:Uncharacterized protein n=1 Tax=Callosobruchus maculatus TaxID=64391 RepID=A0A653DMN4_CALMS|nr:unnamed protein product [Callosobruchus maculatus]
MVPDKEEDTFAYVSAPEAVRRRQQHASQINVDIKTFVEQGLVNKVQSNVQKTQATTLTKKSHVGLPTVEMEGHPIAESPSVKPLGINIEISCPGMTTLSKLGVLFRCRELYTQEQLLLLYKAQIRSLKHCSHDLHSLEHQRRMAYLSLFYRFYHGRCSSELSQIITPKAVRTRNTREALRAHPYQVGPFSPNQSPPARLLLKNLNSVE